MLDIEENRLNNVTVASDNHNESTSSSSILTEGQLRFFSTPEFIRYYNSLQNIYIGTDTFENHFISSYFTTSDIVIEKYIEGINKYNFFNAKETHFTTQTLCNEYIKVVKGLSLDPEIKSYIISSLYIAPLSAIYWYPE